jgi:RHS repeat-associated protein
MLTEDNNGTLGAARVIMTSTYDKASNRLTVSATINGTADFTRTYTYDAINRMTEVDQSGSAANPSVFYIYNALGQITYLGRGATSYPGSSFMDNPFGYDGANRVTGFYYQRVSDSGHIADYSWTLDAADRITSYTSTIFRAEAGEESNNATYSYDTQDQLLGVDNDFVSSAESYTYDSNGNRTGSYSNTTDNRLTSDGTYTYTYDNEGNRLTRTAADGSYLQYKWDHRSRLSQVLSYGPNPSHTLLTTTTYTYDASDRRIQKQISGSQTLTERYSYDGSDLILAFDGSTPVLKQRYMYGAQDGAALTEETAATGYWLWLLADQQGTIRTVTDGQPPEFGTILNFITYDSFGNILPGSDTPARFAYTGQEYDPESGLYYYNARYYDPKVGRFISQDPIGFEGGDSNLYRYVGNNSVNEVDPSGLITGGGFMNSVSSALNSRLFAPFTKFATTLASKASDAFTTTAKYANSIGWNGTFYQLPVLGAGASADLTQTQLFGLQSLVNDAALEGKAFSTPWPGAGANVLAPAIIGAKQAAANYYLANPDKLILSDKMGILGNYLNGKAYTPMPTAGQVADYNERRYLNALAHENSLWDSDVEAHGWVREVSVRAGGLAQASFGLAGAIVTAPLALTGVGAVGFLSSLDNLQAGLRTTFTGDYSRTGVSAGTAAVARAGGASDEEAAQLGEATNALVGLTSAAALSSPGKIQQLRTLSSERWNTLSSYRVAIDAATLPTIGGNLRLIKTGPVVGSGNAYSVAFETNLPKPLVPIGTREAHNQAANLALLNLMDVDPAFANQIRQVVSGVDKLRGPLGGISYKPPANWTWNHALSQPGVMQLVPRVQHMGSSPTTWLMHSYPTGTGGFAQWGQQY